MPAGTTAPKEHETQSRILSHSLRTQHLGFCDRWSFTRFAAGPSHTAAVAIRREPLEEIALRVREVERLPHPR
jgi:hypothetical protein